MDEHVRMDIVTDLAGLEAQRDRAACVLVDPDDPDDADLLAALVPVLPHAGNRRAAVDSRRPLVYVDDDRIAVLTLVACDWDTKRRTYLLASGDRLVVVGDAASRELARQAVSGAAQRPVDGLAKVLAAIARAAEDDLDRISDAQADTHLSVESNRMISGELRRETSRRRGRLFEWRQLYAVQARLLDDDEPLAEALGPEARQLLRPARGSFRYAAGVADRLYAALGDLLAEQDTLATQRLTLVSTVFLPLTVTTGFFGMNFDWLTGHIGSAAAFVVLGVVIPVLFVLAILGVVRRYGV
jgi:hypothetical protein